MKEIFNRIAYAPTWVEYGVAVEDLRKYKPQLVAWVERNEPNIGCSQNSQRRGGIG